MAYILGFFYADGYITVNKRGGHYWSIHITDKDLLYSMRKIVQSEHTISMRKGSGNEKDSYRLQVGSKEMCNDLMKIGLTENKTRNLTIPDMPKKYFSDFVRGYFDGDGNVWVGQVHKDRKTALTAISTSFTSCSKEFLSSLKSMLATYSITGGEIIYRELSYFRFSLSIKSSLKLYDFMYNRLVSSDNSLLLKRKRIVFEKFIKMRL